MELDELSDELPDELYEKITALSEEGNELSDRGDQEGAIERFETAYDLLPDPREKWDAAMWLVASIGDCLFLKGDFKRAGQYFREAQKLPDGLENPFIFYRLGQCLLELGDEAESVDALISAYMLAGEEIFSKGDPKYFEFLKEHAKIGGE
jgi:tetratricopeptide (TPR) repeat protein